MNVPRADRDWCETRILANAPHAHGTHKIACEGVVAARIHKDDARLRFALHMSQDGRPRADNPDISEDPLWVMNERFGQPAFLCPALDSCPP